jgi:hypothetical protein
MPQLPVDLEKNVLEMELSELFYSNLAVMVVKFVENCRKSVPVAVVEESVSAGD